MCYDADERAEARLDAFVRCCAADLAPCYSLLAQHWGQAEAPAKAIQYLEKAGAVARARGDDAAALGYFNQSLALSARAAVLSVEYYAPASE